MFFAFCPGASCHEQNSAEEFNGLQRVNFKLRLQTLSFIVEIFVEAPFNLSGEAGVKAQNISENAKPISLTANPSMRRKIE